MENKADRGKGIALLVGFVVFIAFLIGFCLEIEWKSENTSQEQTQNIEDIEETEDGKRQPCGFMYQDKETGVCYFVIKDDTENIQAMAPRYNADGSIMVKEVKE